MSIQTTGAEWNRFYNDKQAWPEDTYHDDTVVLVNGSVSENLDHVPDTAILVVQSGCVIFPDNSDADLVKHFEAWLNTQTTSFGGFAAPKDKMEAVKAAIVAAGGTVTVG